MYQQSRYLDKAKIDTCRSLRSRVKGDNKPSLSLQDFVRTEHSLHLSHPVR